MAPGETKNNAYAKFGVTNQEHYGMLWYFLEWSIYRVHANAWESKLIDIPFSDFLKEALTMTKTT